MFARELSLFGAGFDLNTEIITPFGVATSSNIENLGNDWYRCSVSANANGSGYVAYGIQEPSVGQFGYYWGAQVNEGSTAKDYQKTETRLNIPRLDYSNGTCPSLLVEPQRTNIMLYSSSLDSAQYTPAAYGTGTISRTANYGIAPDGTMSADRIQMTKGDFAAEIYQRPLTTPGTYTLSFWAKSLSGTPTLYTAFNNGYENPVTFTTEWVRYEYTYTNSNFYTGFNLITYTGLSGTSASADLLVWGVQLEAGNYSTSYIPTTSASVTRNADVISKTGISSLIGQTEGTLFVDVNLDETSDYNGWFLKDNASYDTFVFLQRESNGIIAAGYYGSGALQARIETASGQPSGHYKIAFGYKNNNFVMYVNGTQIGTDTSGSVSGLMDYFDIHFGSTGTNHQNAAALWKTRLTNTQLAQLTTI